MAVADETRENTIARAAVAAATAAVAYGLKRVFEQRVLDLSRGHDDPGPRTSERVAGPAKAPVAAWDVVIRVLLPIAEDAAQHAGVWVAQNAPDLVRDRIVRRFIYAFDEQASAPIETSHKNLPASD